MVPCIRSPSNIKRSWLMRHFVDLDRDIGGVVALDLPAFGAHIACAEQRDSAVPFADDDAAVNGSGSMVDCGVDVNVEVRERVAGFPVVVAVQA